MHPRHDLIGIRVQLARREALVGKDSADEEMKREPRPVLHYSLVKGHQRTGRVVAAFLQGHRPGGNVPRQVELLLDVLHIIFEARGALVSATRVGEGDASSGSPTGIVFALGGDYGAAVIYQDSTSVASATR